LDRTKNPKLLVKLENVGKKIDSKDANQEKLRNVRSFG
jgi:hypothetical protein